MAPYKKDIYMAHSIHSQDTNQPLLLPDIQMAERFLTFISQCHNPLFAFQIFPDKKKSDSPVIPPVIPRVLCGTFEQHKETLTQVHFL